MLGVLSFLFYRSAFFLLTDIPADIPATDLLKVFWSGIQADSVTMAVMLFLPALYHVALEWFLPKNRMHHAVIRTMIFAASAYAVAVCLTDLAYYRYFGLRITSSVFTLMSSASVTARMLLTEYGGYLLAYTAVLLWLWRGIGILSQPFDLIGVRLCDLPKRRSSVITLFSLFILIETAQGFSWHGVFRIGEGEACATASPELNQVALNPVKSLTREVWRSAVKGEGFVPLMPDSEAVTQASGFLKIAAAGRMTPPVRTISSSHPAQPYNVVIILMESMAADHLRSITGEGKGLRFLDSLAGQSILFDHFYSAGIHTYNGVFSSLYGLPALQKRHPMNAADALQPHSGLSTILKERNYLNLFFCPHDASFDNLDGFLSANGFDRVISATDYSHIRRVNMWGTDDRQLLTMTADYLDTIPAGRPFLSVVLTASNHRPFKLPKSEAIANPTRKDMVDFADRSLAGFFDRARKSSWFENTVFVLLGDHGAPEASWPHLNLSYHHVPLLIRLPGRVTEGRRIRTPSGQIDLTSTIMGILDGRYVDRTLGVDLLKEERPYMFFSSDQKIACIGQKFLYVKDSKSEVMFDYRSKDPADLMNVYPDEAVRMRRYALSMIQTAFWMVSHRKLSSN